MAPVGHALPAAPIGGEPSGIRLFSPRYVPSRIAEALAHSARAGRSGVLLADLSRGKKRNEIGTIGAGAVAVAPGRETLARGHEVVLSSRRGPDTLADAVAALGRCVRGAGRGSRDLRLGAARRALARCRFGVDGPTRLQAPEANTSTSGALRQLPGWIEPATSTGHPAFRRTPAARPPATSSSVARTPNGDCAAAGIARCNSPAVDATAPFDVLILDGVDGTREEVLMFPDRKSV